MGSKYQSSHNAGLQVAIGTVKDTGKKPGLQFDFNILQLISAALQAIFVTPGITPAFTVQNFQS